MRAPIGLLAGLLVVWAGGMARAEEASTSSGSGTSSAVSPTQVDEVLGVLSGSLDPDALDQGVGQLGDIYEDAPPIDPSWGGVALEGFAPFEAPVFDPALRQEMMDDLNERLNSPNVESEAFTSDARVRGALLEAINAQPDPAERSRLLEQLDEMEGAVEPLRRELDETLQAP
jgi:hypothetical protein